MYPVTEFDGPASRAERRAWERSGCYATWLADVPNLDLDAAIADLRAACHPDLALIDPDHPDHWPPKHPNCPCRLQEDTTDD